MNIMKTNMLLLDSKRILNEDPENSTVAKNAVPETDDPQKGMNALTFQGLKNVISNPQLSSKIGNIANAAKEGLKNNGGKAMMMAALLPSAMIFTSCDKKDSIDLKQEQNVSVNVDGIMALIEKLYEANLLTYQELQQMRADIQGYQANQAAYNDAILAILSKIGNNVIDVKNGIDENNAYQQLVLAMLEQVLGSHEQAVALLQYAINLVTQQGKSIEEAMQYIINQLQNVNDKLDTIISNQDRAYQEQKNQTGILQGIKDNTEESNQIARAAYSELQNVRQTIISCNNSLSAKLDKIDDDMNTGFDKTAQEIGMTRTQLLAYMKKMNIDIQNNNNWNAMMIKASIDYNTHVTQKGNEEMAQALADLNAGLITVTEFAERTANAVESTDKKMSLLAGLINKYGSNLSSTANAALAELIKGNIKQDRANYLLRLVLAEIKDLDANIQEKLEAILQKSGNGTISQEDIDTIISLLQNIDTNVTTIKNTLNKLYEAYITESKKNDAFRKEMIVNGHINTQIAMSNNRLLRENNETLNNMNNGIEALNSKADSLITLGNTKPDELIATINQAVKDGEESMKIMNMHQDMRAEEIIAAIKNFQNTYVKTEREEIKLQKQQNGMMNYALALLKNKNSDNTAVLNALQEVINAINSGKEDITAELQKANSTLEALLEKVGLVLDEMGKVVSTMTVYGNQIINNQFSGNEKVLAELKTQSQLLRDANGKLDLNNLSIEQLKAEVVKIKPSIQTLVTNSNTANNYLNMIYKKAIEMNQKIENIDNGNGITAQELDSIWNNHDAAAYAKAEALAKLLHAEDITKLDEVIALMKQGNTTNNNIYVKLSDFANKNNLTAEQLKALLQAVYDYLPELKCNCNCQGDCNNNKNHEGIIGDLIS